MRYIQAKTLIQKSYNYNVYRGCTHGCIYCDSRSACYQIPGDFEDIIVKENAVVLARNELQKKRKKIMIQSGSMCDPYMPIEKELQLTRKVLEVVLEYGHGAGFLTKNDLALRDLDIYCKINQKAKAVACFTLTTVDDDIAKIIEPRASLPSKRLEALKRFSDAGIATGAWMTPLLPGITANKENVQSIVEACSQVGVSFMIVFEMGTTMREGSREFFYQKLDQHYPGLKERYQSYYKDAYECRAPNHHELWETFKETCTKHHIIYDVAKIKELYRIPEKNNQLQLFE
jgi:DNA repair photolyase